MRRIFHQKWWMIALEVVGVVLLLFVGLVIAVAVTSPPLPQTKATATQVPATAPTRVSTPTPTQVPTVAPTVVPTKAPPVVPTPTAAPSQGEAVLGALLAPFIAKYRQPTSCSNPPLYNFKSSSGRSGPVAGGRRLRSGGGLDQHR